MSHPSARRPWFGIVASIAALVLVGTVAAPAQADPVVVFDGSTAEFGFTLTSDADNGLLTATVINHTAETQHFGIGVDLDVEGETQFLWEQPWQLFRDQRQALVEPGQTYDESLLPQWPGMTYTFYSWTDGAPVEFAHYLNPGRYLPFHVEGTPEGDPTSLQVGFPVTTYPATARAGEQLRVRAYLGAAWPGATAEVWLAPSTDDDTFNATLIRGLSAFGVDDVSVTDTFTSIGSVPVSADTADGMVHLPADLVAGDYALLVGDSASDLWPAGPNVFVGDVTSAYSFAVQAGAPRGTTDGTHLEVSPVDQNGEQPVLLTFNSVDPAGVTTVTTSPSGPTPTIFAPIAGGLYYDLTTTAGFDSVTICLSIAGLSPEEQAAVALYHYHDSAWEDITAPSSPPGQICGVTDSFSPFAIGFPLAEFTASAVPTVSGTKTVGATLIANRHTWDPVLVNSDFGYQWYHDGAAILGATGTAYTLVPADAGTKITVTVTAAKPGYVTRSETSATTGYITGGVWTAIGAPVISGTPAVGQYLYADPGVWAPAATTLRYTWTRADGSTTSSTSNRYTVRAADAGTTVSVRVAASKPGFPTVVGSAKSVAIEGQLVTTTPTISGSPLAVGSTLTAQASWGPSGVHYGYQWNRGGVAIPDAVGPSYVLVRDDAGQQITVTVTGTLGGYTTVSKTSGKKTIQSLLNEPPVPTIVGAAVAGSVLTATAGTWGPGTVTLRYQWLSNGVATGGNSTQYTVKNSDAGKSITVNVTGSQPGFTSRSALSAGLAIESVFTTVPKPTVSPGIAVGQVLTALPGSWNPSPTTFSYVWKRDGLTVIGAASTYSVTPADRGHVLTVTVLGAKSGYTTATSAPSAGRSIR